MNHFTDPIHGLGDVGVERRLACDVASLSAVVTGAVEEPTLVAGRTALQIAREPRARLVTAVPTGDLFAPDPEKVLLVTPTRRQL